MPAKILPISLFKALFVLCLIVIAVLSVVPHKTGQDLILPSLFSSGADLHALAYAVTMLIGLASFRRSRVSLSVFLLFYGTLLEIIQVLLPTRTFNPFDILANVAGIFIALVFYKFFEKLLDKHLKQRSLSL
jgi:hypothetical protein